MKVRKKPIVVDAYLFNRSTAQDIKQKFPDFVHLCYWKKYKGVMVTTDFSESWDYCTMVVETLEGDMIANEGDYIIQGVEGELYPVKSSVFKETYEEVGDGN